METEIYSYYPIGYKSMRRIEVGLPSLLFLDWKKDTPSSRFFDVQKLLKPWKQISFHTPFHNHFSLNIEIIGEYSVSKKMTRIVPSFLCFHSLKTIFTQTSERCTNILFTHMWLCLLSLKMNHRPELFPYIFV